MDLYTIEQMSEMMIRTRTWVLAKPSGMLPPMPYPKYVYMDNLLRVRENNDFNYPDYKDPHWIIKLLLL